MTLTSLTLEAYQELNRAGRVEQVSDPLIVVSPFGKPVGDIVKGIEFQAKNYTGGVNAYIMGESRQTESGLVTPFVLYKVLE